MAQLYRIMPQEGSLNYKAEASGANMIVTMLRNGWFEEEAWTGALRYSVILSVSYPNFAALIDDVPKLRCVDFLSLRIHWHDYAN